MTHSNHSFQIGPRRRDLETILMKRQMVPPSNRVSWERETARGIFHNFGEYDLVITNEMGDQEEVFIKEDVSMIATRVWDCSVVTAKWLENSALGQNNKIPNLVEALGLRVIPSSSSSSVVNRPIQVLELGAGTGLLSICLAKMGAAVLSTEYGPAVSYLKSSCDLNQVTPESKCIHSMVSGKVTCRELDWYKTTETLQSLFHTQEEAIFDLIVVTDCSLTERDVNGVFEMIQRYGTKGHTKVIAGVCNEREGTPHFIASANLFDNANCVPRSAHHPNFRTDRHTILTFDV